MNLHVAVWFSMVLLSACCASFVSASHSSRNIILNGTFPIAFVLAKSLTLFLTMSIPLSSLAFSSNRLSLYTSPNSVLAMTSAIVLFPTPAGPANNRCGRFLCLTNAFSLLTISPCPFMSSNVFGLYFSVQIADSSTIPYLSLICMFKKIIVKETYTMSSSETTMKSPSAITALKGIRSSPSLLFSSSSFSVYCVGFLSTTCMSSPDFTSNTMSPTSPNLFPLLLTTVFPISCLENFF